MNSIASTISHCMGMNPNAFCGLPKAVSYLRWLPAHPGPGWCIIMMDVSRCSRCPEQPRKIFVDDKGNTGSGKDTNETRAETTVETFDTFIRPSPFDGCGYVRELVLELTRSIVLSRSSSVRETSQRVRPMELPAPLNE